MGDSGVSTVIEGGRRKGEGGGAWNPHGEAVWVDMRDPEDLERLLYTHFTWAWATELHATA